LIVIIKFVVHDVLVSLSLLVDIVTKGGVARSPLFARYCEEIF
jgi:hypothetical protein